MDKVEKDVKEVAKSAFLKDVEKGLKAKVKYLNSKYFYDETGDRLFQEIMELPEYYLSSSEQEILQKKKGSILSHFSPKNAFELIDLGAGDAYKTKILLEYFNEQKLDFTYVPIDISKSAIREVSDDLQESMPDIEVEAICNDYLSALKNLDNRQLKLILFLGANIGNFTKSDSRYFLSEIAKIMKPEDLLLIGFDLKKDPQIIKAAYDDSSGVTAQFNINILQRINRELGANFDLQQYEHAPSYDATSGEAKSYIKSKVDQSVNIPGLQTQIHFKKDELLHTEISKKYSMEEIHEIADECGFEVKENLMDDREYFTDSLWKLKIN